MASSPVIDTAEFERTRMFWQTQVDHARSQSDGDATLGMATSSAPTPASKAKIMESTSSHTTDDPLLGFARDRRTDGYGYGYSDANGNGNGISDAISYSDSSPLTPPGSPPASPSACAQRPWTFTQPPPPPLPSVAPIHASSTGLGSTKTMMDSVLKGTFFRSLSEDHATADHREARVERSAGPRKRRDSGARQLPDLTAWKEKMINLRNSTRPASAPSTQPQQPPHSQSQPPAKAEFSFEAFSAKLKTSLAQVATGAAEKKTTTATAAAASNNIHTPTRSARVHARHGRAALASATIRTSPATLSAEEVSTSPYGELLVVEILAARELAEGDLFQGESDPYVVVRFRDWARRTTVVKGSRHPIFNEQFVFWVPSARIGMNPSSSDVDTISDGHGSGNDHDHVSDGSEGGIDLVSITVMNKNLVMADEHLGEVHLSLAGFPANETLDGWYPLVKDDGEHHGHLRVALRRLLLPTIELQLAAQALGANERSLNGDDLAAHGDVLPALWYGFAEAAVEPLEAEAKVSQADVLASRLHDLSRRFMNGVSEATATATATTTATVTSDSQRRHIF